VNVQQTTVRKYNTYGCEKECALGAALLGVNSLGRPLGGMVVLGGAAAYEVAWFQCFEVKVRTVVFLGGVDEVLRCISSFASLHPL
jgi:vacuolar-type H+-ATPase subunit I/STV1